MDQHAYDSGPEFERRALALARAIHDPLGMQGSVIVDGSERDALFIDDTSVFAYEFTTRRDKAKAEHDAKKLANVIVSLQSKSEHRYKSFQGRFVTESEPTADQRHAVGKIAKQYGVDIHPMSLLTLRKWMIDTENYIALRLNAPFGSAGMSMQALREKGRPRYVQPTFVDVANARQLDLAAVLDRIKSGGRIVIRGDYGAGKSAALAELFTVLRKDYFKDPSNCQFPIHINLRDLRGLRTAREAISRHCEEVAFPNERSLLAAWRAGNGILLLDGFDELVPVQWVGNVRHLADVRKTALQCVRELIRETPEGSGVVVAGRAQYFSGDAEILESLGLPNSTSLVDLQDFSEEQAREFLGGSADLPNWVPTRPVLLQFWMKMGMESFDLSAPGPTWREFLFRIAAREGERVPTITAANILRLISSVAATALGGSAAGSEIGFEELMDAYLDVFGRHPDDEGLQALMRLPGLSSNYDGSGGRRFIDDDLRDAAFGISLADYVGSPETNQRFNRSSWTTATGGLAGEVAAAHLEFLQFPASQCMAAIRARQRRGLYDAVLLEVARCADAMGLRYDPQERLLVNEVIIPYLNANGEGFGGLARFTDCLIDELDLSSLDLDGSFPVLVSCVIHQLSGFSAIPSRLADSFVDCEVQKFSSREQTTDGILQLALPIEEKVALTVLKKVYAQRGSGRKEGAFSRGLAPRDRPHVPSVVDKLERLGYLRRHNVQSTTVVLPIRSRRAEALRILENPTGGIPGF